MQQQLSNVASGDNVTGHITVASTLGSALAIIQVWFMQAMWNITVPQDVALAFTVVLTIAVSVVMRFIPQPSQP